MKINKMKINKMKSQAYLIFSIINFLNCFLTKMVCNGVKFNKMKYKKNGITTFFNFENIFLIAFCDHNPINLLKRVKKLNKFCN